MRGSIPTWRALSRGKTAVPEEIIPGVAMPKSVGYGFVFHDSGGREEARRAVGHGALIDLDIAFELITERYPSLVVFTRLHWVLASPSGIPNDEEWVALGAFQRRSIR